MLKTSLLDVNLNLTMFDFDPCNTRWKGAVGTTWLWMPTCQGNSWFDHCSYPWGSSNANYVSSKRCCSFLKQEYGIISWPYICICKGLPSEWQCYHCHPSSLGISKVHQFGVLHWIQLWDLQGMVVYKPPPSLFTYEQHLDYKFFTKVLISYWYFIELCNIILSSNYLISISIYGIGQIQLFGAYLLMKKGSSKFTLNMSSPNEGQWSGCCIRWMATKLRNFGELNHEWPIALV